MAFYSYYEYLVNYYSEFYDDYFESHYWPIYYGIYNISNDSWCATHEQQYNAITTLPSSHVNTSTQFNCTPRFNETFPPNLYGYEPWWFKGMDVLGPILTISAFIFGFISLIIAIYFFKHLIHQLHEQKHQRPDILTIILSSSCIVCNLTYNILEIPCYWFWYFDYNKDTAYDYETVWEGFWCLSKVLLYSLYSYRYFSIRKARTSVRNAQNTNLNSACFALIFVCILVQIVLEIMYTIYRYGFSTVSWDNPEYKRQQRQYLNAGWSVMAIDFVLVLFLGYLVTRNILQVVVAIDDPFQQKMSRSVGSEAAKPNHHQHSSRVIQIITTNSEQNREKRSSKQMELIQASTRCALTCMISLLSSFVMQCLWITMEETENMGFLFFSYFWGLDSVINMFCVYFSMAFAQKQYLKVCGQYLKCHYCCLWCVMSLVAYKADQDEAQLAQEFEHQPPQITTQESQANGDATNTIDVAEVAPESNSNQI
eukprot:1041531_1